MKTKIKVIDAFEIANRIIFNVEVIEGTYLIGDIYKNDESNLEFELKGVTFENNPESVSKTISVKLISDDKSKEEFKNKLFYKVEN